MKKLALILLLSFPALLFGQQVTTSIRITKALQLRDMVMDSIVDTIAPPYLSNKLVTEKAVSDLVTAYAQPLLTNPITGTGTANTVVKFLTDSTVGNSIIYDNGSYVGLGTPPNSLFDFKVLASQWGKGMTIDGLGLNSPEYQLTTNNVPKGGFGLALNPGHFSKLSQPSDIVVRAIDSGDLRLVALTGADIIFSTAPAGSDVDVVKLTLENDGDALFVGSVTAPNFVSTVTPGTQPYYTLNTTLNDSLNAGLLDGHHWDEIVVGDTNLSNRITADSILLVNEINYRIEGDTSLSNRIIADSLRLVNLNHSDLNNVQAAASGVTEGHITDQDQTIGGSKSFSSDVTVHNLKVTNPSSTLEDIIISSGTASSIEGSASVYFIAKQANTTNEATGKIELTANNIGGTAKGADLTFYTRNDIGTVGEKARITKDGNINAVGTITAPNFVSNVATGTQPYATTSTTLNSNFNSDFIDGYHYSDIISNVDTSNIAYINTQNTFSKKQTFDNGITVKAGTSTSLFRSNTFTAGVTGRGVQILTQEGNGSPYLYSYDLGGNRNVDLYFNKGGVFDGIVTGTNFVSNVAIGTQPYATTSTTLNTNLNAQLWNSYLKNSTSGYLPYDNGTNYVNSPFSTDGTNTSTNGTVTINNIGTGGLRMPTSISGVGAGLTTRATTGESIIQFGNNLYSGYTGPIDITKAGAMIRLDTRNGTGATTYGGQSYTLFQIQTRTAGVADGTHTIPFQLQAAPTGSFIMNGNGEISLDHTLILNTIANETTDVDKFLVSNAGRVKYRTGSEILSDIGGAAALSGTIDYLPIFTSATTIGNSQLWMDGSVDLHTPAIKANGDLHSLNTAANIAINSLEVGASAFEMNVRDGLLKIDAYSHTLTWNKDIALNSKGGKIGAGVVPLAQMHVKGKITEPLTGTVSVTAGTNTVTGIGTLFTSELVVGDAFMIENIAPVNQTFTVTNIASNTSLTISVNHTLGASGKKAYKDADLFKVDDGNGVNKMYIDKRGNAYFTENVEIDESGAYKQDGQHVIKIAKNGDSFYSSTISGTLSGSSAILQTAYGRYSGNTNSGTGQVAYGTYSGYLNTGNGQTAVGGTAGMSNSGIYQAAFGTSAGASNSGSQQSAFGLYSGGSNTASSQSAFGSYSGYQNTGSSQAVFGYSAGRQNTGTSQTAVGAYSGYLNTGGRVTSLGYGSANGNTGADVVAIGYEAGKNNTTANQFIVKQSNINTTPLIQGDFSTGSMNLLGLNNISWIQGTNYIGSTVNLFKLSQDNLIEFGQPLAISSLYHVANQELSDIVNIPITSESVSGTSYGVGMTVGGTRILEVSGVADGTGGLSSNKVAISGKFATTATTKTIAAAGTTFTVSSNVITVTGDAGGNTIATIIGGISGQVITLIFVDALVTITDTSAATANTINLSAAFTSSANDVMTLVFDGNKWFEVSRSLN